MALVFFEEEGAAERVGLFTENGRIPVDDLARFCKAHPAAILIQGQPLRVDAGGLSELSWEQLKQEFSLVGSRNEPVKYAVCWNGLLCGVRTFCHESVTESVVLGNHALQFRRAFNNRVSDGQKPRLDLDYETEFLAQAASFWADKVPRSLYEGRIVAAFRRTESELQDGVEQVVRKARRRSVVQFGLAVACDVRKLVPLIVFPGKGEVVKGCEVELETLDGLMEVEFQMFAAVRLELGSSYTSVNHLECSRCTLVDDGSSFWIRQVYVHSDFRGGTYCVEGEEAASSKRILKTGPTEDALKLARAFSAYGFDWRQVECEAGLREFLARSGCNLSSLRIPKLLHWGSVAAPQHWAGRPALIMSFEGESLASRVLPLGEVEAMGLNLVTTLATLQAHGVYHCDICPRNVAYDEEMHTFCLLDFGAALYGRPAWQMTNGVTDIKFGGMSLVLWCSTVPQKEWDFESLLFTMLEVAGFGLPWGCAADALQLDRVQELREEVVEKGSLLRAYYPHVHFPPIFHALERLMLRRESLDTMLTTSMGLIIASGQERNGVAEEPMN